MSKNDGGPAFPKYWETTYVGQSPVKHAGMSLRDYFAAAALQGLTSAPMEIQKALVESGEKCKLISTNSFALASFELADAMLEARDK